MSNIKKHLCPSCGGNLTVDNDRQKYFCKSCGSTYDYEYFREEEMHDMGETYLLRGEFMAAIDAYKFILKKDPHDFIALRGLMLAAAGLKNINELNHAERNDFSYDTELVREATEAASEEDREYFDEWKQIYSDIKRLSDYKEEIESLRNEQRGIGSSVNMKREFRSRQYKEEGLFNSPKKEFVAVWIFAAAHFLISIFVFFAFGGFYIFEDADIRNTTFFVMLYFDLIGIIAAVINLVFVYPKMKLIKDIDKAISELFAQSDRIEEKINNMNSEADKFALDLTNSRYDFIRKDKQIMTELSD